MSPFRILLVGPTNSAGALATKLSARSFDRSVAIAGADNLEAQYDDSLIDCLVVEPPVDPATLESLSSLRSQNPAVPLLLLADTDMAADMTQLLSAGAIHVPTVNGQKNERLEQELRAIMSLTNSAHTETTWQQAMKGVSQLYAYPHAADLSESDILRRAAAIGQSTLGYEIGYGTQAIDDSYKLIAVVGTHNRVQPGMSGTLSNTYCQNTIDSLQTVSIADTADEAVTENSRYQRYGFRSYIGAPIIVDESVYGTLCFADSEPKKAAVLNVDTMVVRLLARWVSSQIERTRFERELIRQADRIEEFAEVVSVDLRNKLNVIQGRNAILSDMYNDRQSELIKNAADQIESIVEDSLEWVQKGKPITKPSKINAQTLVDELWYLVTDNTAELRLVDSFTIHADWSRLIELFENLIKNMIANNDQNITIRIGELNEVFTTTRAPTTGASGFYVECDGRSVPDVDPDKVFQPADVTRLDETGFKLSIVKQIAEAHGWDVTLTEGIDDGVRFEFTDLE